MKRGAATAVAKWCRGDLRRDEDFNESVFAASKQTTTLSAMDVDLLRKSSFAGKAVALNWKAYVLFKDADVGRCPAVLEALRRACPSREELLKLWPADLRSQLEEDVVPPEEVDGAAAAGHPGLPSEIEKALAESEVSKMLSCTVCYEHLERAVQCPNGHLLCTPCLDRIAEAAPRKKHRGSQAAAATDATSVKCPTCRQAFPRSAFGRNLLAEQMAAAVEVRCPFGCGAALRGPTLNAHRSQTCQRRPVKCALGCCTLPYHTMAEHLRAQPALKLGERVELGTTPTAPRWRRLEVPDGDLCALVSLEAEARKVASEDCRVFSVFFRWWKESGVVDAATAFRVTLTASLAGGASASIRAGQECVKLYLPASCEPEKLFVDLLSQAE